MIQIIKAFAHVRRVSVEVLNLKETTRNAGHSKWSNIKHTKQAMDAQRGKTFIKMSLLIRQAIQEGGNPDPKFNSQLANAIEQAKSHNMPLAKIQDTIKLQKDSKANAFNFEIRGPGGCTIIVLAITDNLPKLKYLVKGYIKKTNSSFTDGLVQRLFDHKGVIVAKPPEKTTLEIAVEHAIEVGAEDVTKLEDLEENVFQFICAPLILNQVRTKLEKLQYDIKAADCEFIPYVRVNLSDADLELARNLCDKLEEHPDVVNLYDNIA